MVTGACGSAQGPTIASPSRSTEAPTPTTAATPSLPSVGPSATAGPSAAPPTLRAGVEREPLDAGTYAFDLGLRSAGKFPKVLVTLPEGWANDDGWIVGPIEPAGYVTGLLLWDVVDVYAHPCQWQGPRVHPGPTVDDLVAALVAQPLRNATEPDDVTINGYHGKRLEWSVPDDADFTDCDVRDPGGEPTFESWTATGWSSDRYQQGPGQVDRLWIIDVDGARLVIDAQFMPEATEQQVVELMEVVESLRFER
jgi:hypothetical protein